jgi:hypothetical protein
MLRKAAKRPVGAVSATTPEIMDTVAPDEYRNYFRNAGYGSR